MAAASVGENWTPADVVSLEATADFSAAKGKVVALTTSGVGKCELATDADSTTLPLFGVVVENAASTATSGNIVGVVPIASGKIVKVLCDGVTPSAVLIGSLLTVDASAMGFVTTADEDYVIGIAMGGTTSASAFVPVLLGGGVADAKA